VVAGVRADYVYDRFLNTIDVNEPAMQSGCL